MTRLKPAHDCIICGAPAGSITGSRIVHRSSGFGIFVDDSIQEGTIKHSDATACTHSWVSADDKNICVKGAHDAKTLAAIDAAISNNLQPWYCQSCVGPTCHLCRTPLRHAPTCDIVDDVGRILHVPYFAAFAGCASSGCPNCHVSVE